MNLWFIDLRRKTHVWITEKQLLQNTPVIFISFQWNEFMLDKSFSANLSSFELERPRQSKDPTHTEKLHRPYPKRTKQNKRLFCNANLCSSLFLAAWSKQTQDHLWLRRKKRRPQKNEIFLQRTNSRTFLISTGKCHKEREKANHQLTRWNVSSKICGIEECMKVAEELRKICKEVEFAKCHGSYGSYICVKKNGQKPECSSKAGGKSGLFEYLLHRKDLTFSQARKKVDADIGDMEKVTVSGALKGLKSTLKDCAKISSLLERCKSWRPRLRLKKRRRVEAENKKLGDYSH